MSISIISKALSKGLGKAIVPLAAALLMGGCSFVSVFSGGGGGLGANVVAALGSGGALFQSNGAIGNSPSLTFSAYSSSPEQDGSNANDRLRGASLTSLTPSFQPANENRLTSSAQGGILLSTGTINALVREGVVDNDVPLNQGTDQGLTAGFVFVGGGTNTSTIARSPAIGQGRQSPVTTTASRVVIAYGKRFTGGLVSTSQYEYSGAFAWTRQDNFTNIALGQVTVTVNIGGASQSFSISGSSTDHSGTASFNEAGSIALSQSSNFTFDENTGRFRIDSAAIGAASNTNGFRAGTSGTAVPIILIGQFAGANGQAVSGVFATIGDTANEYVGAFVGDGPTTLDEATVVRLDDGGAVLDRSLNFLGASAATQSHFVTADFSQLYAHISSPLADVATEGLLAKISALGSDDGETFAAGTTATDCRGGRSAAHLHKRELSRTQFPGDKLWRPGRGGAPPCRRRHLAGSRRRLPGFGRACHPGPGRGRQPFGHTHLSRRTACRRAR